LKRCPKCETSKDDECFTLLKSGKLYGWCKECKKASTKIYQLANKEIISTKKKQYYKDNKVKILSSVASWQNANREKVNCYIRANKINRKRLKSIGMTGKDYRSWVERQKKVCYWCEAECCKNFHVDHVMPMALGGRHEAWNLSISCPRCNMLKGAMHPLDWIEKLRALPDFRQKC
jgi:hypothetical protein